MNPKNAHLYIILVSIVFTVVILIVSQLLADKSYAGTVTNLLIALWFIPFTYIIKLGNQSTESKLTNVQGKASTEESK